VIQGRKRLQKIVFFLQYAGCPLDCNYTLHHFGPYSKDVADTCDEMVAAGLITEKSEENPTTYSYELTESTLNYLAQIPVHELEKYKELAKTLIVESMPRLELGSTILFFYDHCRDWEEALRMACEYKNKSAEAATSLSALELARSVYEKAGTF